VKFFDLSGPFFRPVWIRITIVAICVLWALIEFANGGPVWGCLFLTASLLAAWQFATVDYAGDQDD